MAIQRPSRGRVVDRPSEGTLSEVINTVVGKGLVIDVFARASLLGIKAVAADVRIVVTSVDTSLRPYLRLADAATHLSLSESEPPAPPKVVENLAESGRRPLEAASEGLGDILGIAEEEEEHEYATRPRRRRFARAEDDEEPEAFKHEDLEEEEPVRKPARTRSTRRAARPASRHRR
jgi:hypothetical protein